MNRYFILFLIVFGLSTLTAHADDTAFGGSGASPMPITQGDVAFIDERVVIASHDLGGAEFGGVWTVTCDFTFKNTSNKKVNLTMGFPFPVKEELGAVSVPKGRTVNMSDPLVYDFKVWVRDKEVSTTRKKIKENPAKELYYKDAYIWDMTFKPNETVKVRHTYITGVTFDAGGHTWASYVLKTGGMWKDGKIGRTIIEVIPNTPTKLCKELKEMGAEYLIPKPAGVKSVGSGKNRKYVWNLRDFTPREDVDLCMQTGRDHIRYGTVYPMLQMGAPFDEKLKKMNARELRITRNSIFAQYGRTFKDQKLQEYFDKQWWYTRNPNYSDSTLTEDDKKAIAKITKIESQKRQ